MDKRYVRLIGAVVAVGVAAILLVAMRRAKTPQGDSAGAR
jgi:hypothetical protein